MTDNPYDILGIEHTVNQDDIRKAYRRLAKEHHPDLNPGNKEAEERFKKISAAYNLLSDPEKRQRFDRGEIDASGAEQPSGPYYRDFADGGHSHHYQTASGQAGFEDLSDLFGDLFKRRQGGAGFTQRGNDHRYRLDIDFLEAANGSKKRIGLADGGFLDITIPEGTKNGQTLRLGGKGGPGADNGPSGDALIQIRVHPHTLFERKDDNILIELPITIDEAILGATVGVPTLSGQVRMKVPKGTNSGTTMKLEGKGLKRASGKSRGDQLVKLKIMLPKQVDEELTTFMASWQKNHKYDPRVKLKDAV